MIVLLVRICFYSNKKTGKLKTLVNGGGREVFLRCIKTGIIALQSA
jgi:hypothetical protein